MPITAYANVRPVRSFTITNAKRQTVKTVMKNVRAAHRFVQTTANALNVFRLLTAARMKFAAAIPARPLIVVKMFPVPEAKPVIRVTDNAAVRATSLMKAQVFAKLRTALTADRTARTDNPAIKQLKFAKIPPRLFPVKSAILCIPI